MENKPGAHVERQRALRLHYKLIIKTIAAIRLLNRPAMTLGADGATQRQPCDPAVFNKQPA